MRWRMISPRFFVVREGDTFESRVTPRFDALTPGKE